jgi:GDP-L-fucose synthase
VNIGVGEDVTITQLAELVRETTGFDGEIEFDTSKPDGTPRKLMDVSVLTRAGWKARTPLVTGLRQAYHEFASTLA